MDMMATSHVGTWVYPLDQQDPLRPHQPGPAKPDALTPSACLPPPGQEKEGQELDEVKMEEASRTSSPAPDQISCDLISPWPTCPAL